MKNAFLSSYSYSNNGWNKALIDTAAQKSSNLIAQGNNFCISGNFSSYHGQFGVEHCMANTQSPCSVIFSESTSIMQNRNIEESCQGETHLNFLPAQEDIFYQPWKSIYLQQSNNELQLIQNARKRSMDASDAFIPKITSSTCDLITSATNEKTPDKKRPRCLLEKQPKIQKEKVPVVKRRSLKLNDKITALQKLVSPYGKTDAASVLLEASIAIKALHDQIKDLLNMISREQNTSMIGEMGSDLQNRGLCLVPSATLTELDRRSLIHCHLQ